MGFTRPAAPAYFFPSVLCVPTLILWSLGLVSVKTQMPTKLSLKDDGISKLRSIKYVVWLPSSLHPEHTARIHGCLSAKPSCGF